VRYALHHESNEEKKQLLEKEIREYTVPKYLGRFNSLVKNNKAGKYLVGDSVSVADFWMAHFVNVMDEKFPGVDKDYPELFESGRATLTLPGVKEWVQSRPVDDEL